MDGWLDGRMDGRIEKRLDRWMGGRIYHIRWMDGGVF